MNPMSLLPLEICPTLPPGAEAAINQINGYVLGTVIALFVTVVIVGVGAIVSGRVLGMPHVTKGGVVTLVVAVIGAVLVPVVLPVVQGLLGTGCIG